MFNLPVISTLFNNSRTIAQNFGNENKGIIGDHNTIGSIIHNTDVEGPAVASGGVFYAYIHSRYDDNTHRMIIIFGSREIADEWWRAVSTSEISQLKGNIQRVTPQFYNHHPGQWNFISFFTDPSVKSVSDKFRGKMFIVLDNSGRGITIIPLQCIVDHTSGSSFCIRSKSDPQQHWDIDEEGRIYVSDKARTSFVVTAQNNVSKRAVMVGSDQVTLSTSRGAVVLHKSSNFVTFSFVKTSAGTGYLFRLLDLEEGRFFVEGSGLVCIADQEKCGLAWELAM